MASVYRVLIDAVVSDITANVAGASTWIVSKSKPWWYPAQDPSVAMWFEGEDSVIAESPSGSLAFSEAYILRYWEYAGMDEATLSTSDAEQEALYVTYETVRDRFVRIASETIGSSTLFLPITGRIVAGGDSEDGFVRGFELTLRASRFRTFT